MLDKQVLLRKRKVAELARAIRKKYLALKLGKSEEDETLKKMFKPITGVLKTSQYNANVKTESIKKEEPMEKEEEIKKEDISTIKNTSFISDEEVFENSDKSDEEYEDSIETNQSQDKVSEQEFQDYLEKYHHLIHPYVKDHWQYSDKIDRVYGPTHDPVTSKWKLGKTVIDFTHNGWIVAKGDYVVGTRGLYELIFYKEPNYYTEDDVKRYITLLELTNAHKKLNGTLKGTKTYKWNEIIKPNLNKSLLKPDLNKSFRRNTVSGREEVGSGIPTHWEDSDDHVQYVYWDDPNELCERLKLLMAEQKAGNTASLNNEIVAIINELREADIIY
ncbi:uncharacterized protein LOC126892672 [Diabrotica virgifera virgifera]|uniref:DUF8207 domain-containing protein n=1 Tax=Diabrotica virgifera virgifera TaxID=50390 RepID=A0ABM5L753_DIAVI|nr:uncharacterized protein LOC126892672 [Diabrotica virgifera virgifera]